MDVNDCQKLLGRRIEAKRIEAGYSQRQFALMVSTSQSYLWKLENGRVAAGLDVLCRVASALDIQVRDLLEF